MTNRRSFLQFASAALGAGVAAKASIPELSQPEKTDPTLPLRDSKGRFVRDEKGWATAIMRNQDGVNQVLSSFNTAECVIAWGAVRKRGSGKFKEVEMVIKMHVWEEGAF